MAKTGNQFSAIELPFDSEFAAVERLLNGDMIAIMSFSIVINLVLLKFEVEVDAEVLCVVEDDSPLI